MAANLLAGILFVLITSLQLGPRAAVRIEISPERFNILTDDSIEISCLPDIEDADSKEIYLIELCKDDGQPVVLIRHGSKPSYTNGNQTGLMAEGQIDKDVTQSYLNLTLKNPKPEDEGTYTCTLLSLDKTGLLKEKKASTNLRFDNLYLSREDKILLQKMARLEDKLSLKDSILDNKITVLEETQRQESKNRSDYDAILTSRITALEKTTANQTSLIDKVFYNVAFMVTNNNNIVPKNGAVFILPDIIWSIGTGYDNETGVFTAPVSGMYVFFVTVRTTASQCAKEMVLMVNDDIFTRLYGYAYHSAPQNSITSVVDMQAGDRVFLKMNDACAVIITRYTFFTGYLLKAI